jgi:hypothetical protein
MSSDGAKFSALFAGACLLAFAIVAVFIAIMDTTCALRSC